MSSPYYTLLAIKHRFMENVWRKVRALFELFSGRAGLQLRLSIIWKICEIHANTLHFREEERVISFPEKII